MMAVGICTIELHIPDSGSLKSRRKVLRHLKERIRQSYNVSVSELDDGQRWQRAVLGIACVGNERRKVNQVLDKVVNLVEGNLAVSIISYQIEIL